MVSLSREGRTHRRVLSRVQRAKRLHQGLGRTPPAVLPQLNVRRTCRSRTAPVATRDTRAGPKLWVNRLQYHLPLSNDHNTVNKHRADEP
eukprot:gene16817-biopygen11894